MIIESDLQGSSKSLASTPINKTFVIPSTSLNSESLLEIDGSFFT